jgi:DNA-binding transcriptional ArsR family regulator
VTRAADRFAIEREIARSDLPAPARAIANSLCRRIDAASGTILPRHSPSIAKLARETGYHPATICRHLTTLETAGWITRHRYPSYSMAAAEQFATHYAIHIPAADSDSPPIADIDKGLPRKARGAIAESIEGYRAKRANHQMTATEQESSSPRDDSSLAQIVKDEIATATGRELSDDMAAAAVRLVLDGREPRNAAAYLRRAVRADPRRFVPVSIPPTLAEREAELRQLGAM